MGEPTPRPLSDRERVAWLRLIRTDNVGPVSFHQLLGRFGSAEAALEALPGLVHRPVRLPPLSAIEDEIAALAGMGGRLIGANEPDYPPLLKHISGAPPLLAMIGGDNLDWLRTIGIVGARNASVAGQKLTRMLALDLGEAGYTVVSGLARGIDSAAHRASLATGTVAVLAGGMDRIYPEDHAPLAREIVDRGGALVTEMPLGWEPRARDFPRRNRLVSGLSRGVLVVEAAKRSGSLITARLALEQDREVFAVPGSPLDPRAEGCNALIQQGARLITSARDILSVLNEADSLRLPLFEPDWQPQQIEMPPEPGPDADDRSRLMSALSLTPTAVDDLISQTGIRAGVMQTLLFELDLDGRIEWSSGQLVALKA
jgi:DNA processing protein